MPAAFSMLLSVPIGKSPGCIGTVRRPGLVGGGTAHASPSSAPEASRRPSGPSRFFVQMVRRWWALRKSWQLRSIKCASPLGEQHQEIA